MNDVVSLLSLPTDTLAAISVGYMAYRIGFTGKDATHSGIDVVFMTLVFALVFRLASVFAAGLGAIPSNIAGLAVALGAAMLWRRWGERAVFRGLRMARISVSDRSQSAWDRLRVDPALIPSQIVVRRKDGTWLMCDRIDRFNDHATGACIFGADGSVAFYATDAMSPGDDDWVATDVSGPEDWGDLMTYIPAAEIAQISLRY